MFTFFLILQSTFLFFCYILFSVFVFAFCCRCALLGMITTPVLTIPFCGGDPSIVISVPVSCNKNIAQPKGRTVLFSKRFHFGNRSVFLCCCFSFCEGKGTNAERARGNAWYFPLRFGLSGFDIQRILMLRMHQWMQFYSDNRVSYTAAGKTEREDLNDFSCTPAWQRFFYEGWHASPLAWNEQHIRVDREMDMCVWRSEYYKRM